MSTCVRQRAHRKKRAGLASVPSGSGRGRGRQRVRYCPRIRALHGVGHGADVRLASLDRRRACLPDPTGSYRVFLRRVSAPIRRHSWRRRAAMDWLAWRGPSAGRQSPTCPRPGADSGNLQPRSDRACRRAQACQGQALRVAAKTRPALTGPARGGCAIWRSGRKNARGAGRTKEWTQQNRKTTSIKIANLCCAQTRRHILHGF